MAIAETTRQHQEIYRLRQRVRQLEATLVEERAQAIYSGEAGRAYTLAECRIFARAALITEGLLQPSSS